MKYSEEKFRNAFETSPDSININRLSDGLYIDVNSGFLSIMGYDREEIIGKTSIELNIWADTTDRDRLLSGLRSNGIVENLEARFISKSGEIKNGLMSAKILEIEGELFILSITRDITSWIDASLALKRSEEKYRGIFENIRDVFYEASLEREILEVSPSIEILSRGQYKPEDVIGKNLADFYQDPQSRNALIETLLKKGTASDFILMLVNKDKSVIPCSVSASIRSDSNTGHKWIVGSLRDISERIAAEKEQENLENQLRQTQKMESIGRLAGGIAHDFNNMLGVILGQSEMILQDENIPQKLVAEIHDIRNAAIKSSELTRQLLGFARQQTIVPKIINLNSVVENMMKMIKRIIGEDIELIWIPEKNLSRIKIDPTQIDQVLANLCVNSRDAIKGNGTLTIKTSNCLVTADYESKNIHSKKGNYAVLTIQDNGIGMEKSILENIFEPFFTTKSPGEGTGLGLSTVYGIVKQNEGFIDLHSEKGKGTTFSIFFPVCNSVDSVKSKTVDEISELKTGHETILLVEDDVSILKMTTKMLEKFGYEVIPFNSPVQCLEKINSIKKIDLLITDVIMPGMNGKELVQKLNKIIPDLKNIFISGYTANIIENRGILDDDVCFLQKPFSSSELYDLIKKVLKN